MTDREEALLWLNSFVKNKEPMTLIPKQLIRLMYDVLKEQEAVVRCKDCKYSDYGIDEDGNRFMKCIGSGKCYGGTEPDWFCADGERKQS